MPEIDSLPRSFFHALPRGLKTLTIGVHVEADDDALNEFVMRGWGAELESFRVRMRIGRDEGGEPGWGWRKLQVLNDLDWGG